jgi:Set1/Ash2 histone methyltransferase complex subunit ASH2
MDDHSSTGASASASINPKEGGKKASSRRVTSPPVEQVSAATLAALAQASANLLCLPNLLMGVTLPSVEQLTAAATKLYAETPPFVHLAKNDSAPQLKIENHLTVKGGMRGYRMTRASHGVSEGTYYYEIIVKEPPSVQEIAAALPPNVRLGPKLQKHFQEELMQKGTSEPTENEPNRKKVKKESTTVGGHLRVGWSMRTADLQAPVGYDKWSFGIRDISGSRIHNSKRHDHWGGEPFGPGDVVGLCMTMGETGGNMRAFKNGDAMGHFIITKGKREGGECFEDIPEGVYYPAISVYMGGTCQVNFGPYFIYPPRQLPSGMKVLPVSDLSSAPSATVDLITKALPKKLDEGLAKTFQILVRIETEIRYREYQKHLQDHVQFIRLARQGRGLSVENLPTADSTTPVEANQSLNEQQSKQARDSIVKEK